MNREGINEELNEIARLRKRMNAYFEMYINSENEIRKFKSILAISVFVNVILGLCLML